ncbi:hypothetical protein KI387_013123, partial [Taxus chinensis]
FVFKIVKGVYLKRGQRAQKQKKLHNVERVMYIGYASTFCIHVHLFRKLLLRNTSTCLEAPPLAQYDRMGQSLWSLTTTPINALCKEFLQPLNTSSLSKTCNPGRLLENANNLILRSKNFVHAFEQIKQTVHTITADETVLKFPGLSASPHRLSRGCKALDGTMLGFQSFADPS